MSQQINLYDPALKRKRELLTGLNVAVAGAVMLLVVGAWGGMTRAQANALGKESEDLARQVKAHQDQLAAVSQQLASLKPDPRLAAELASARQLVGLRSEIQAALKKGLGSESVSIAEFMRGFARQAPGGLWLTGFSIADDGSAMEIRGRMTEPSLLPEYIKRLNGEKAFQGRVFATLQVTTPKPATETTGSQAPVEPAAKPMFHEFVLIPAGGPGSPAPSAESGGTPATRVARVLAESTPVAGVALFSGDRAAAGGRP